VKRIALAVPIAAVAIAAGAFATAGSAQSPATTTLHLVATTQKFVGVDPPSTHPPRAGDRYSTGDTITGDDTGIDRLTCTVTSRRDALCAAVAKLSKGTLTAEGLVTFSQGGRVVLAITGGTGSYAGASGTATVTDTPHSAKTDLQITLLTPENAR
jgi:hypothetical protein